MKNTVLAFPSPSPLPVGERVKVRGGQRFLCIFVFFFALARPAWAVVGQAEEYDPFRQADLEDFHENLMHEEKKEQLDRSDELRKLLKVKGKELKKSEGKEMEEVKVELTDLEKELLQLPKRDRFSIEMDGQAQYDSNISRNPLRKEKGDSVFDTTGDLLFDLSGRKTDLRFDVRGGKQWNIHYPEKDFWSAEERIRYRRKYFKKITQSLQSRLARTSQKTVEIDGKKIRWDSFQNTAFNYVFSRKLSLNLEGNANKRFFTHEFFDQDSSWEASFAPSAFWNFTPKSRVSVGYQFGANRIRTKSSDTNTHEIHAGYFGKITNKTSMSSDIAFSHQTPRSLRASTVNTVTVGKGIIWQATPKTQATLQFIRSLQNTTSNTVVEGSDAAANAVAAGAGTGAGAGAGTGTVDDTIQVQTREDKQIIKTDSHFVNESLTFSLNYRLSNKIQTILTWNGSHTRSKVFKNGRKDNETRQFLFPTTLAVNYIINRWARLRLAYTFTYRTGDEKPDSFRSHLWMAGLHLVF